MVRLLVGASDVAATMRIRLPDVAGTGHHVVAQLGTRRPVIAALHDLFILRTDSPPARLAGGGR